MIVINLMKVYNHLYQYHELHGLFQSFYLSVELSKIFHKIIKKENVNGGRNFYFQLVQITYCYLKRKFIIYFL